MNTESDLRVGADPCPQHIANHQPKVPVQPHAEILIDNAFE